MRPACGRWLPRRPRITTWQAQARFADSTFTSTSNAVYTRAADNLVDITPTADNAKVYPSSTVYLAFCANKTGPNSQPEPNISRKAMQHLGSGSAGSAGRCLVEPNRSAAAPSHAREPRPRTTHRGGFGHEVGSLPPRPKLRARPKLPAVEPPAR